MKIVPASYKILDRRNMNAFQKIEHAGRLAYKSEDKITDDSATPFVNKIYRDGHYPVIEFAVVHVCISIKKFVNTKYVEDLLGQLLSTLYPIKYVVINHVTDADGSRKVVISGTVRGLLDSLKERDIKEQSFAHLICATIAKKSEEGEFPFTVHVTDRYQDIGGIFTCDFISAEKVKQLFPNKYESHLMCAVKFIHNRAFTHELVRHRPCSFLQESQRYCRYSNDKFGNEVTFIAPFAFYKECLNINDPEEEINIWMESCKQSEEAYFKLLKTSSPQAARTVLPNSCKTEIIIYTTIEEWRHIFSLRTSPAAEPSMREVMCPLAEEFFSEENQLLWE